MKNSLFLYSLLMF